MSDWKSSEPVLALRGVALITLWFALPGMPIYWGITGSGPFRWVTWLERVTTGVSFDRLTFLLVFCGWAVLCTVAMGKLLGRLPGTPPSRGKPMSGREKLILAAELAGIVVAVGALLWVSGWLARLDVTGTAGAYASTRRLAPGDHVSVRWHGAWYPATVVELRGDDILRVHYVGYDATWDEVVPVARVRDAAR